MLHFIRVIIMKAKIKARFIDKLIGTQKNTRFKHVACK